MIPGNSRFLHCCKLFLRAILFLLLAGAGAWCAGAAFYCWKFSIFETIVFASVLAVLWVSAFFVHRAVWMLALVECCIISSFLLLTPERRFRDEKWNVECRKLPQITRLPDGKIKFTDVRDFRYRTPENFDVRYKTMTVDPADLVSMDVVFSYWGYMDVVAHTLLYFRFRDHQELVLSLEPRVPLGMKGGCFFPGIYRQYGKMMLFATREDVLYLRIKYRKETVYFYRSTASGEVLKNIFMETVSEAEKLMDHHAFYNSVSGNCTTGLRKALLASPQLQQWDFRWLFNGFFDRYLFEKGFLKCREKETFASLKAGCLCYGSTGLY